MKFINLNGSHKRDFIGILEVLPKGLESKGCVDKTFAQEMSAGFFLKATGVVREVLKTDIVRY